jgi:predicted dehydrogenase
MNSTGRKLRLGMIGAGNVVETYHLPVLTRMNEVEVSWVCDLDSRRAKALASLHRIPRAVSSIADAPEVDACLVAIPVGARRETLEKVLARGWHAFCEKPFAPTVRDHEWIMAEARRRQRCLGIGLVRRHYDSTRVASRLLDRKILGAVESILGGEGMWMARTGRGSDWYQANAQSAGGGVLSETGSHLVDQAFAIARVEEFTIQRCNQRRMMGLEFETNVQGSCRLADGATVPFAFAVSRMNDVYNGVVIRCENGDLRVGLGSNGTANLFSRDGTDLGAVGTQSARAADATVSLYDAIRAEWREFLGRCTAGAGFSDWDTGYLTTAFIEACYTWQDGRRADVESEVGSGVSEQA